MSSRSHYNKKENAAIELFLQIAEDEIHDSEDEVILDFILNINKEYVTEPFVKKWTATYLDFLKVKVGQKTSDEFEGKSEEIIAEYGAIAAKIVSELDNPLYGISSRFKDSPVMAEAMAFFEKHDINYKEIYDSVMTNYALDLFHEIQPDTVEDTKTSTKDIPSEDTPDNNEEAQDTPVISRHSRYNLVDNRFTSPIKKTTILKKKSVVTKAILGVAGLLVLGVIVFSWGEKDLEQTVAENIPTQTPRQEESKALLNNPTLANSVVEKPAGFSVFNSVIAKELDSNNSPQFISDTFTHLLQPLYYHFSYKGKLDNSQLEVRLLLNDIEHFSHTQPNIKYSGEKAWMVINETLPPGVWLLKLYADGSVIDFKQFAILSDNSHLKLNNEKKEHLSSHKLQNNLLEKESNVSQIDDLRPDDLKDDNNLTREQVKETGNKIEEQYVAKNEKPTGGNSEPHGTSVKEGMVEQISSERHPQTNIPNNNRESSTISSSAGSDVKNLESTQIGKDPKQDDSKDEKISPVANNDRSESSKKVNEAKRSRLYVRPSPANSRVRIINIKPKYEHGIELPSGNYHIEVSATGYQTSKKWISLGDEEINTINISLEPDKTVSKTGQIDEEFNYHISMLQSTDDEEMRKASIRLFEDYKDNSLALSHAEKVILAHYKNSSNSWTRNDALAYLCKMLGASKQERFRATLSVVAQNAQSLKLTMYAKSSLGDLDE